MRALVVYDSMYGNTQQVAQAIAAALDPDGSVRAVKVDQVSPQDLMDLDALVVGSPVQAWRPSKAIQAFLNNLPDKALSGVKAAAFDTRYKSRLAGSAADRIQKALRKAGCTIVAPATPFIVLGSEGPLAEGELDKATAWGEQIRATVTPAA